MQLPPHAENGLPVLIGSVAPLRFAWAHLMLGDVGGFLLLSLFGLAANAGLTYLIGRLRGENRLQSLIDALESTKAQNQRITAENMMLRTLLDRRDSNGEAAK